MSDFYRQQGIKYAVVLAEYAPAITCDLTTEEVVFGSDWPAMPASIKENVEQIQSLPLRDKTIEGILYKNAERILLG